MIIKKSNENIYSVLKKNAYKNNKLFQVELDITNKCNANCYFCFQGSSHKKFNSEMTTNQIYKLLEDLKKIGVLYLGFSGGEPFCRKDFLDILSYSKRLGFMVTFVTNMQIISQSQLEQLIEIGVDRFTISFHSSNPKTYSKMFGVDENMFFKVLDKIKFLISSDCRFSIACTVTSLNMYELSDIKKMFINLGLNSGDINFNMLIQGESPISDRRPTMEQIITELGNNKDLKTNILKENISSYRCSAGIISCSINSKGDVFPCTFMNCIAGNVLNQNINEIWYNSHLFKLIRSISEKDFTECYSCDNNKLCHVCMANNMNETNYYNIPDKKYCEIRKGITNCLVNKEVVYENQ